jgi:ABC-type sugar transport system permease subunit
MKTVKPHILYVSVILAIITFIFWVATFTIIYVADDQQSPAADERSVPAPRSY